MLATLIAYDVLYYKNKQWHVLDDTESLAQARDLAREAHLEKNCAVEIWQTLNPNMPIIKRSNLIEKY